MNNSPGAALSALRPIERIVCSVCGKEFTARVSKGPRYCSASCRSKARYWRDKSKSAP